MLFRKWQQILNIHQLGTTKEGLLFLYQYEEISKKVQVNKYFYHMKCLELPSNKTKYV